MGSESTLLGDQGDTYGQRNVTTQRLRGHILAMKCRYSAVEKLYIDNELSLLTEREVTYGRRVEATLLRSSLIWAVS